MGGLARWLGVLVTGQAPQMATLGSQGTVTSPRPSLTP